MAGEDEEKPSWKSWEVLWRRAQDVVPWMLGAAGVFNELFIVAKPRPEAWPIIGVLLGLPFARKQDQREREEP